jgi:hypothetical protein
MLVQLIFEFNQYEDSQRIILFTGNLAGNYPYLICNFKT